MTNRQAINRIARILLDVTLPLPTKRELQDLCSELLNDLERKPIADACPCLEDWTDGTAYCQQCGKVRDCQ